MILTIKHIIFHYELLDEYKLYSWFLLLGEENQFIYEVTIVL